MSTKRMAEVELLILGPDPDAAAHYAALAVAVDAENGRTCEWCGNQFARTRAESPAHWRARKFCGRSCAGSSARVRQMNAARSARIEDLEWIIGTDSPQNVAHRLGYASLPNLLTVLRRWGRNDLSERLTRDLRQVAS